MRRLNPEFHARLRKLLRDNKQAVQYLAGRGLTLETAEHFGLGLSAPYFSKRSEHERADALAFPLRGRDGRFYNKYGYYNVPGVTRNPLEGGGWTSGEAHTYYAGSASGRNVVFICQEPLDLWRHWQALAGTALGGELLLLCSTRPTEFPEEWEQPHFWAEWESVYVGLDSDEAGEVLASRLFEMIGRESRRVRVPPRYGKGWTSFWQGGADIAEFTALLRDAPPSTHLLGGDSDEQGGYGRFAYKPLRIDGTYHSGHLYYTIQILSRAADVVDGQASGRTVRDARVRHYQPYAPLARDQEVDRVSRRDGGRGRARVGAARLDGEDAAGLGRD